MLKNALIVDDSRLARLTLRRLLEKYHITVYEAEGVLDAERWISSNPLPDLVFMDVMMPDLDGFEGLSRLRAEATTKHLPVIMYSGDISEEARKKARDKGATGYLPKPADPNRLEHLLMVFNQHKKSGQSAASQEKNVSPAATNVSESQQESGTHGYDIPISLAYDVSPLEIKYGHLSESIPIDMKRRLDDLERRLSAQDPTVSNSELNVDMERLRRDVVYLLRQFAKYERYVRIALVFGGVSLFIMLIVAIRQLL